MKQNRESEVIAMKKDMRPGVLWNERKRIVLFALPWTFTKYSLTSERLFIETGVFTKREDEVRLYRIMDISLTRSFWQRIFGLGTIRCCSADKTLKDFEIKNIKNSRNVKELLSDVIEKERMAKRVVNREYMEHDDDHDDHDDFDDDHND